MSEEKPVQTARQGAFEYSADGKIWLVVSETERYEFAPWEKQDYLTVKQHLLKNRLPPADAIKKEFAGLADCPELKQGLIDRVYRDIRKTPAVSDVTNDEVVAFLDTDAGAILGLFIQLSKADSTMTQERAEAIFWTVSKDQYLKKRDESAQKMLQKLGLTKQGT